MVLNSLIHEFREFDPFAESAGFMEVSDEVLGSLLDDDGLVSESEERVLKGVVRWMTGGGAMRVSFATASCSK